MEKYVTTQKLCQQQTESQLDLKVGGICQQFQLGTNLTSSNSKPKMQFFFNNHIIVVTNFNLFVGFRGSENQ